MHFKKITVLALLYEYEGTFLVPFLNTDPFRATFGKTRNELQYFCNNFMTCLHLLPLESSWTSTSQNTFACTQLRLIWISMPISHGLRLGPDELLLFSNNVLAYKTSRCGNSEAPTDFLIRPLSPQKKIIIDLGPRNQGPKKKKAFTLNSKTRNEP